MTQSLVIYASILAADYRLHHTYFWKSTGDLLLKLKINSLEIILGGFVQLFGRIWIGLITGE